MFALKTLLTKPSATRAISRFPQRVHFHATPRPLVKAGDAIPDIDLLENSPGNKVSLAQQLAKGKGLIIGVPAAFSPSCSEKHIPAYVEYANLKDAGDVYVVSVNGKRERLTRLLIP